ncbi:MAG: NAD(P)-dependent oxidoreductase [Sandaracinus sp.]
MRVLVTGAAGYLGGHVVARLSAEGHAITALVRSPSRVSPWLAARARPLVRDLSDAIDPAALEGHDACVHLAVLWPETGAFPELGDVSACVRLFDALGRAGVSHVLYASSAAVHRPFVGRMTEADRIVTADAYGAAKASAEHFLHASASEHGFRASVVRPGPCVGLPADPDARPRTPRAIGELVEALRESRAVRVIEGEGRQLTACADLAEVIGRMLSDRGAPSPLLAVSRETTVWAEIATSVATRLGKPELVDIAAREASDALPAFDTSRLERWLGRALDASSALEAHLDAISTLRDRDGPA